MISLPGIWLKYRILVILAGILLVSAGMNVWQYRAAVIAETEAKAAIKLASSQAQLEVAKDTLANVVRIAAAKIEDDKKIDALTAANDEASRALARGYRIKFKKVPTPECRVIPAQVAAINEALHGK